LPYYNYLGQLMPETPTESGNVLGTPTGDETINAPAGNTSISGNGGGDLLIGSSGGNRFWITDGGDRVSEQPGGGIDTEIGWLTIKLAPNVENLIVHQDFNHGIGNDLDNLMMADGRSWLYGGKGNDVLVGDPNATTTFAVHKGEGNDVIYNWQGLSQLQLTGYNFTTGAQVRAAMTQQGADTVLNLGGGETLTFRNANAATSFQDKQFLLNLDTSKLGAITFQDDFSTLSLWDPSHKTGTWQTNFGNNLKDVWSYSLISNGEQQVYTTEGFEGTGDHNLHLNPFSVSNGVLSITAQQIQPSDVASTFGQSWSSGMINTLNSFQQQYGYFEMRAQFPNAEGSWPAFWMIPWPYQASTEADIVESIGISPNTDYRRGWGGDQTIYDNALKLNPNDFHNYGMLWTKDTTTFYIDGVAVLSGPTPANWTSPMGLIVNMALGGWGGNPDPSQFPASMKVDWVHAYALADGSTITKTSMPDAPFSTIQDKTQPASTPPAATMTFDDTGQALSTAKVIVLTHDLTTADVPQAGRAFLIWQTGGQVQAAVANDGYVDTPTVLMAGGASTFSGAGTFLTDGRVVVSYMGTDAGQPAAYALIFDPATHKAVSHELGPSNGQVKFVALDDGNFAASWHTASGQIFGRAYNAYAYDSQGWWGPVRDLPSDATGVSAQGDLITASGASYTVVPFAIQSPDTASISGPVTHAEGNSGFTDFTFTVTRSDTFWQRGTVAWKVTGLGSNPADGQDFAGGWMPSGVLTFQGSSNTATITVRVASDAATENNEQFQVTLFNPVGTTLGSTVTSTGTITNDDGGSTPPPTSPQIALATPSVTQAEGNSGVTAFNYTVTRTGDTSGASTVSWAVAGSGANPANAADFQGGVLPSGSLSFTAGQASKTITVNVVGDATVEPNEGFTLTLSGASGATLGTATASGSITNDDGSTPPPSGGQVLTSPGAGSNLTGGTGADTLIASQGNDTLTGGAGADVFRLPSEPWAPITVTDFAVGTDKLDLSALFQKSGYSGTDPVGAGYVQIQGQGADTLILYDRDASGSNPQWPNFILKLQGVSASGLTWAQLSGGGGSTPPPTSPQIALATPSVTQAEGNSGATAFNYTVTRTGDTSGASTVSWAVAGSGANPANAADFQGGVLPSGSLSFTAGQTSKTITVNVVGDATVEPNEGFTLTLSGATGATLGTATAAGTITNDDGSTPPPSGGQVLTSPGAGSSLTGGTGADTLIASQGNDTLTGGAGADVFRLPNEPWAPITVTDFAVGTDKLDLSALFQKSGYSGTDPVGAGYVQIQGQGADTLILYDRDAAGSNPQWPNFILKLQAVSASGLTWAQLSGGGGSTPPPTSPQIALATPSVSLAEGNSGVTAFNYTVTRTGDTSGASTVSWAVAGSGANPANAADFQGGVLPSGSLSFTAGQASKTITVNVVGDATVEQNEGFTLTLSGATGATLGTATAAGTITNDDGSTPPPSGGQVLTSPGAGSNLTGGTGADTLIASQGNDTLTGGAGADVFRFPNEPWAPIHVTDFTPGVDKLDFKAMLQAVGYTGSDPIADHYMSIGSDGAGGAILLFDRDAGGSNPAWPNYIIDLEHIAPAQVKVSDWIIS